MKHSKVLLARKRRKGHAPGSEVPLRYRGLGVPLHLFSNGQLAQPLKFRHRLGYFAVDPKSFAAQNAKLQIALFNKAMNIDYPISTGLHFMAGVIPPSESTQNKLRPYLRALCGADPESLRGLRRF